MLKADPTFEIPLLIMNRGFGVKIFSMNPAKKIFRVERWDYATAVGPRVTKRSLLAQRLIPPGS